MVPKAAGNSGSPGQWRRGCPPDRKLWQIIHLYLFCSDQIEGKPTDVEHHHGVWWFPIGELPEMFWPEQRQLVIENREMIRAAVEQFDGGVDRA